MSLPLVNPSYPAIKVESSPLFTVIPKEASGEYFILLSGNELKQNVIALSNEVLPEALGPMIMLRPGVKSTFRSSNSPSDFTCKDSMKGCCAIITKVD